MNKKIKTNQDVVFEIISYLELMAIIGILLIVGGPKGGLGVSMFILAGCVGIYYALWILWWGVRRLTNNQLPAYERYFMQFIICSVGLIGSIIICYNF